MPLDPPASGTNAVPPPEPLERIARALEKLVSQEAAPSGDIVSWLASIDPGELEAAVTRHMKSMRANVFVCVLEVLKERAADGT